ncbi:MAG: hypothetical protein WBS22_04900 [Methylocystis sp.]
MDEFDEMIARLKRQRQSAQEAVDSFSTAIDYLEKARDTISPKALEVLKSLSQNENVEATARAAMDGSDTLRTQLKTFRMRGIMSPADVAKAARVALLEKGRPMKRGELVLELQKRGIPLAGSDKNKNLGTILWRHPMDFVHLEKFGYWLRDVPLEGVYTPED